GWSLLHLSCSSPVRGGNFVVRLLLDKGGFDVNALSDPIEEAQKEEEKSNRTRGRGANNNNDDDEEERKKKEEEEQKRPNMTDPGDGVFWYKGGGGGGGVWQAERTCALPLAARAARRSWDGEARADAVMALVRAGGDLRLRDSEGRTPRGCASDPRARHLL